MSLNEYQRKRNFDLTPEPSQTSFAQPAERLRFVVQKHFATNLHYDLRLEVDGVLKSWAVPKGPSLNPEEKKLAVAVEDHPLAYGDFEGSIPLDQYGGGDVLIWDCGDLYAEYEDGTIESDPGKASAELAKQYAAGKIAFTLHGQKLKGSFALVKTKGGPNHWLLLKHRDLFVTEYDILQLEGSAKQRESSANYLKPMLLHEAQKPIAGDPFESVPEFGGDDWFFEIKLDGIRCIAVRNWDKVELFSRNGGDITLPFSHVAEALRRLPCESFVMDGEIVYYDETGKPNFAKLMELIHRHAPVSSTFPNIEFCLFDLLELNHISLTDQPLRERRAKLMELPCKTPLRPLDIIGDHSKPAFELARSFGFEGVVGKKWSSRYRAGTRSGDWLKVKSYLSDEFVVVGYSIGDKGRADTFGSLILAQLTEDHELVYVGSVGTGFDEALLRELKAKMDAIRTSVPACECDLERDKIPVWLKPELWAEVRYMDWIHGAASSGRRLRQPVFLRLREDRTLTVIDKSMESILLQQLSTSAVEKTIEYGDFRLRVTKQDKVNYPGDSPATKGDYLRYLTGIWPYIAPHIKGRPLTLIRFPDGIDKPGVFQKHWQHEPPPYVEEIDIWSGTNQGATRFSLCSNLETLLWLGQMGMLEIHAWYSSTTPAGKIPRDFASGEDALKSSVLNYPDFLVFDLDAPQKDVSGFNMTLDSAHALNDTLKKLGMTSFVKTSGKSGLHVYVPIERTLPFEATKQITQMIAQHIVQLHPDLFTIEWIKDKRPNKVYFDYNQNGRGRTLPVVFSARALPGAPVSMPFSWDDLHDIDPSDYTVNTVLKILGEKQDPWRNIFHSRVNLEALFSS